jgi:hypothetical protein
MKIKQQILIAAFALFLGVAALVSIYAYMSLRIDTSTIEHIKTLQRSPGKFIDPGNEINVDSIDDIGFIVLDDYSINIYYGDQVIEMNRNCFKSEAYRNLLSEIGIDVYTHENDDGTILYKVTYWGEEITQFSRVN